MLLICGKWYFLSINVSFYIILYILYAGHFIALFYLSSVSKKVEIDKKTVEKSLYF